MPDDLRDRGLGGLLLGAFVSGLIVWSAACGGTSTSSPADAGSSSTDGSALGDAGGSTDAADSGAVLDGNVSCDDCVVGTLTWGDQGGRVAYQDESSLATCRAFARTRSLNTDGGSFSCTTSIGACGAGPVAVGDVERALAHPDVVAAFAASATLVFGVDSRPVDGTVFRIVRNGKAIEIGDACSSTSAPPCVPVPPGVSALEGTLKALDQQELAKPSCDAFD